MLTLTIAVIENQNINEICTEIYKAVSISLTYVKVNNSGKVNFKIGFIGKNK